jgi:hypothetical protein
MTRLYFILMCVLHSFIHSFKTGTLPAELAKVTGLVQLWLHGNPLSGDIPDSFGDMPDLRILALEDTDITGVVPIGLCIRHLQDPLSSTLSTDCNGEVDCVLFFPQCCTCCGREACGT